jgi:hypothetical protein
MAGRWLNSGAALAVLLGMSGCCSFWEKHCAHPVTYAQPVAYAQPAPMCCQPCCAPAYAPGPPAGVVQQPGWSNPHYAYPANNCCP